MSKIAVLFSGQGAQKEGMGEGLAGGKAAQAVFSSLETIRPDIRSLCFSAPKEELDLTLNTQPAVFAMSMAAYAQFAEAGIPIAAMAGFSLGEYAALAASGVLSLEDAFSVVCRRAEWMQACAEAHPGGMAAVLGKDEASILSLIAETEGEGILLPVNYNCPGQIVVAGDEDRLSAFLSLCKANRIRAIRLATNGAFHSSHMEEAAKQIGTLIAPMDFHSPRTVLYSNVTGLPYEPDPKRQKQLLAAQTKSPVRFSQILTHMADTGIDTFLEIGVGSTLAGFVKRTLKGAKALSIDSMDSLKAALAEL